jgi:CheY-like chemotaxis protein
MADVLWIDDDGPSDGPGRFPYEVRVLNRNGWNVTWAPTGKQATDLLSKQAFQGVILDQMFPWRGKLRETGPVWAGCLLLAWLRGANRPVSAPPISGFEQLESLSPLVINQSIRVILVSAFYDPEVEAALKEIEPGLTQLVKPIDPPELVRRLL